MGRGRQQALRAGVVRGCAEPMAMIVHDGTRWGLAEHRALREYLAAHDLLDAHPEAMSFKELEALVEPLAHPEAPLDEKRRALVWLAHHKTLRACQLLKKYLERPDPPLEMFAKLALEEAAQWIAPRRGILPNEPCPCGSGRKFKACCGGGLP